MVQCLYHLLLCMHYLDNPEHSVFCSLAWWLYPCSIIPKYAFEMQWAGLQEEIARREWLQAVYSNTFCELDRAKPKERTAHKSVCVGSLLLLLLTLLLLFWFFGFFCLGIFSLDVSGLLLSRISSGVSLVLCVRLEKRGTP